MPLPGGRRRLEARHARGDNLAGGLAAHGLKLFDRVAHALLGCLAVAGDGFGKRFGLDLKGNRQRTHLGHDLRVAEEEERTVRVALAGVENRRQDVDGADLAVRHDLFAIEAGHIHLGVHGINAVLCGHKTLRMAAGVAPAASCSNQYPINGKPAAGRGVASKLYRS